MLILKEMQQRIWNISKNHDVVTNNTIQLMLNIKEDLTDEEFEKISEFNCQYRKNRNYWNLDILPNDPKMIDKIDFRWFSKYWRQFDYILSF